MEGKKKRIRLDPNKQAFLGVKTRDKNGNNGWPAYWLSATQVSRLKEGYDPDIDYKKNPPVNIPEQEVSNENTTDPNDYKEEPFVLSAYCDEKKRILSVQEYCEKYNLPADDITSFKFLPHHYKHPTYHIVFKERIVEEVRDFDFESIVKNWVVPERIEPVKIETPYDFDSVTYTDVHIGMEPDQDGSAMYPEPWNENEVMNLADMIIKETVKHKKSNTLVLDDLGDLADGQDGETTRGGHKLPQNMTNEEVFKCGWSFKMRLAQGLSPYYEKIIFNNICNDNHSGVFAYYINTFFKETAEYRFSNIKVTNHRTFFSHYFQGKICFVISHGKDQKNKKYGLKVKTDPAQVETIDQYIKRNKIYGKCQRIIFKKGDSHQALFDYCSSDDFDYFNYHAASPSSQYIQDNFKKGRKGFVLEWFKGTESEMKPIFY
jgi:hypothetical protein